MLWPPVLCANRVLLEKDKDKRKGGRHVMRQRESRKDRRVEVRPRTKNPKKADMTERRKVYMGLLLVMTSD